MILNCYVFQLNWHIYSNRNTFLLDVLQFALTAASTCKWALKYYVIKILQAGVVRQQRSTLVFAAFRVAVRLSVVQRAVRCSLFFFHNPASKYSKYVFQLDSYDKTKLFIQCLNQPLTKLYILIWAETNPLKAVSWPWFHLNTAEVMELIYHYLFSMRLSSYTDD